MSFSFSFKFPAIFVFCIQQNFYPGRLPDKLLYQWQQPMPPCKSSVKNGFSASPSPTGHHYGIFKKIESNWKKNIEIGKLLSCEKITKTIWFCQNFENEKMVSRFSLTELVSQDTILFVRTRSYLLRLLAFTFFSHWVGSTALWHVSTVGKREIRDVWT